MERRVISEKELFLAFKEPLLLRTTLPPSGGGRKVILRWSIPFHTNWEVILVSTHTSQQVFLWLLARNILERPCRSEEILLHLLAAERQEQLQILYSFRSLKEKLNLIALAKKTRSRLFHSLYSHLRRVLRGYRPGIHIGKVWVSTKYFHKRVIGVGYNDHGSLSSLPSWKEQIIRTEEVNSNAKIDELHTLVIQLSFLDFLLSQENFRPADEAQKGRKGEGK